MARHVEDLALLLQVLADPTQFEMGRTNLIRDPRELRGLRVGWYVDDGVAPVSNEIQEAVQAAARALADAGLEVGEASPHGISRGSHLWVELFAAAAQNEIVAQYQGHESEAGPQVVALLNRSRKAKDSLKEKIETAERLADAVLERERLREDLVAWMKSTPLILAPVGATAAFKHGADRVEVGDESISVFRAFSYSQTFNVLGLPSLAVPVARTSGGMPIGVQVIGAPFEERTVFAAARVIEEALGGWQMPDM